MENKPITNKWNLLFQWVLGNVVVTAVVMPIAVLIYGINNTGLTIHAAPNQILVNMFIVVVTSFLFGFFQWLILRSHVANAKQWIWASSIGLGVGLFIIVGENYLATNWNMPKISTGLLAGAIIGITLGIAQWLFLRHRVNYSSLWILANVLGLSLGLEWGWSYFSGSMNDSIGIFIDFAVFMFRLVITYSGVTGIFLIWLLSHPSKNLQTTAA